MPWGAILGAGGGLLSSIFGPKQQTQTTTSSQSGQTGVDPGVLPYRDAFLSNAFGVANRPLSIFGAPGYSQSPTGAFTPPPTYADGQDPWVAGAGDPTQYLSKFMNPFQDQVINGVQNDFDRQRAQNGMQVNDLATKAGAFGGSRAAVLQALGNRDIGNNESTTLGNLRSAGYDQALQQSGAWNNTVQANRQSQINAAMQRFNMAQGYPLQSLGIQQQAFQGLPMGSTYSGTSTSTGSQPLNSNPFSSILGGGLAGASLWKSIFGGGLPGSSPGSLYGQG